MQSLRDQYIPIIRPFLSEKRFHHSLCVADAAVKLAPVCGADIRKAEICGLLHDIMKEADPDYQLQIMKKWGIILDIVMQNSKKLWHAKSGAAYCALELKIQDREMLDAISFHTTARAGMTPLDRTLYLADFISDDRDYDDVDEMRKAVSCGVREGMRYALRYTICDLASRDKAIHPDTLAAFNEIILSAKKQ